MDLNRCKCFKPKVTTMFLDIGCYASAISLLLSEIFIVVCTTKWCLYGATGYTDAYFLFICVIVVFVAKTDIEFLWASREFIYQMVEVKK